MKYRISSMCLAFVVLCALVRPGYAVSPAIVSFTPTGGIVGGFVNIFYTGVEFNEIADIQIGGVSTDFSADTAVSAWVVIPDGATTGKISLLTLGGITVVSTDDFTVYQPPTIVTVLPNSGKVGDTITITGTNFKDSTEVLFNDALASFSVVSDTSITAVIPDGATSGLITVTTPGYFVKSASLFTVYILTSLDVIIDPGAGYSGNLTDVSLTYTLAGPQTYAGAISLGLDGKATLNGLQPGIYRLSVSGSHWLTRVLPAVEVNGANTVNISLANGDADAGNSIDLFDFVVLDSKFGSSDVMADLDGSGTVNLFDYVIIDLNFGSLGDSLIQMGTMVNAKDGAEMVWVSAGNFLMGSDTGSEASKPQRTVYLDGYWIYKYEVTVAQYRKYCQATGISMPSPPSSGWVESHPMVGVNYQDVADYTIWAGVSLPTEAQWEKAARGTDGREYPWGNVWDPSKCANSGNSYKVSKPVGSFPEDISPYGCMDMAGNVFEKCSDWYDATYYQYAPNRNPLGPASGTNRSLRGGSWFVPVDGKNFLSANRVGANATGRSYSVGFRCVKAE